MIVVNVKSNIADVIADMRFTRDEQVPYAISLMLNALGLQFQGAERDEMQRRFHIRRDWVLRGVKIDRGDFATKRKLWVRIHIDEQQGFLSKFEEGDPKSATQSKSVAVPDASLGGAGRVIPMAQRPRAYQFGKKITTSRGYEVFTMGERGKRSKKKGADGQHTWTFTPAKGVFMVRGPSGRGWILRRIGKGQSLFTGTQVLWSYYPVVKTPSILYFSETGQRVVFARVDEETAKALTTALATARPA